MPTQRALKFPMALITDGVFMAQVVRLGAASTFHLVLTDQKGHTC